MRKVKERTKEREREREGGPGMKVFISFQRWMEYPALLNQKMEYTGVLGTKWSL